MKRMFVFTIVLTIVELFAPHSAINDTVTFTAAQKAAWQQYLHVSRILSTFKISRPFAEEVVGLAHKYGNDTFPKAADILAVISIESSFRPNVKSKLKRDKAVGLTQIRPKVWSHLIAPGELKTIENQVRYSAMILALYYTKLGDEQSAINAYNVGITAHKRGDRNDTYVSRFNDARDMIVSG